MSTSYNPPVAEILTDWSVGVSSFEIYRYNSYSAEDLLSEVNVALLGGLTVELTIPRFFEEKDIKQATSVRHVINLAFGETAVHTSTSALRSAAIAQRGDDSIITEQLRLRNRQTNLHGPDEPWFLPVSGVVILPQELNAVLPANI